MYILSVFLSSKCTLFHNSNIFGSCIIHVLYTGCAKIKKKFRRQRLKNVHSFIRQIPPVKSDNFSSSLFKQKKSGSPRSGLHRGRFPSCSENTPEDFHINWKLYWVHMIKGKVFPVRSMTAYGTNGGIAPLILNHRTRWSSMVNVTLRTFYPQERTR